MKPSKVVLAWVLCATLFGTGCNPLCFLNPAACMGTTSTETSSPATLGSGLEYLKTASNSFRPMNIALSADPSTDPADPATGNIVTNFTILVASAAITSAIPIMCQVSINVFDQNPKTFSGPFFSDVATAAAKRSGNKATCTVTIPYSWPLTNRSTDKININYFIGAANTSIAGSNIALCGVQAVASHCGSESPLATIPVPANGATTTETVNATL